ncbi:uncharacterized protein J3D65DRAFT_365987 [Phyllosticta citribraziliensis]|uniref:Uncharacterized protein n=1 Tax=Phyllosticta citribraziliensis TaxID=989973 RepID=A0ABR1LPL1_9PEZI
MACCCCYWAERARRAKETGRATGRTGTKRSQRVKRAAGSSQTNGANTPRLALHAKAIHETSQPVRYTVALGGWLFWLGGGQNRRRPQRERLVIGRPLALPCLFKPGGLTSSRVAKTSRAVEVVVVACRRCRTRSIGFPAQIIATTGPRG